MAVDPSNPYAAPTAPVADVASEAEAGRFVPGGRAVPSGNGWQWIVQGFALFQLSPWIWIVNLVILLGIMLVLAVLPIVGNVALNLLYPVFGAGLMLGCQALTQGEPLEIAHLFAGFKDKTGDLVIVGLLYLVGVLAIAFVTALLAGLSMVNLLFSTRAMGSFNPTALLLALLVMAALMIPLLMAVWFAPALVVFHDVKPLEAMRQSFQGCLKNLVPFLVYGIIGLILGILATIPLGLGWLAWGPTAVASIYASYRDIFLESA